MFISIPDLYSKFQECAGVSTDTRKITPDCLFVALRGDNFDGNSFAQNALDAGAKYALVDAPEVATDPRFLVVEDSLLVLQALAKYHRNTLNIPVVGLTGSNGKTTTKELIAAVLAKKFKTYATQGNFNNHIGVPLTLLAIDDTYEMAVIEMGANHQLEIELLSNICQPTHGLITNIGKAHLEGFGGLAGVRKGKGELYDFLAQTGGTVFVNAQDSTLQQMHSERAFKESVFYLGNEDNTFYRAQIVEDAPVIVFKTSDGAEVQAHLAGKYNFENMAAALCLGKYFGVNETAANDAVASYDPDNNRSQMVEKGTNTIILDAYNANPSSMAVAIENFIKRPASHKMVILGDMLELGDDAPAEHLALGKLVASGHFDTVILAGKLIADALPALPQAYYFPDKFSLHNWLTDHPQRHTHVLIKGSRGMRLETVVPFL